MRYLRVGGRGFCLRAEKTRSQPALVIAQGKMLAIGAAPYPSVQCIILAFAQDAVLGYLTQMEPTLRIVYIFPLTSLWSEHPSLDKYSSVDNNLLNKF